MKLEMLARYNNKVQRMHCQCKHASNTSKGEAFELNDC